MTSPFSTLFLAIQAQLKAQIPEIRFIEQDFGQLEMENPPVSFPCVLIDFSNWQYEQAGENLQFANGIVNVRFAIQVWSYTSNLTPSEWQEKGLSFYDLEWTIYKVLQTFQPDGYDALTRVSVQTEKRRDNLRVREMKFSTGFQDMEAMPDYQTAPLPPIDFQSSNPDSTGEPPATPFHVNISKV